MKISQLKQIAVIVCVFIFFLLLVLIVANAESFNPEDINVTSGTNLTKVTLLPEFKDYEADEDITDCIFINLTENVAGLTSGYAVFKIKNPFNTTLTSKEFMFNFINVSNQIRDYNFYFNESFADSKQVFDYDNITEICSIDNKTEEKICWNETTPIYKEVNFTNYRWKKLIEIPLSYEGEIKLVAFWDKPAFGDNAVKIDWIPEINVNIDSIDKTFTKTEWAWWDVSWTYKQQFNLTANPGKIIFIENISYNAHMQSDFDDLRFLDSTESIELNFTIESKVDDSYATVRINTNGNTTMYMYYGNDGVSTTESANDTYFQPLVYYYMDNNTDSATGIYDGTNYGADTSNNGFLNASYEFIETNSDYINLTTALSGTRTVNIWVYPDFANMEEYAVIIVKGYNTGFAIRRYMNSPQFWIEVYTTTTGFCRIISGGITSNEWIMVTLTFNETELFAYINGTYYSNIDAVGTLTGPTELVKLGDETRTPGATGTYDGELDELGIWDRVLTTTQIDALHNSTEPTISWGAEEEGAETDPPVIKLPLYTNDSWYKSSDTFMVNISAVDDTAIDDYAFVKIGTLDNSSFSNVSNWYNGTITLAGLSEARHGILVYVNDTLNNLGLNNSYTLKIDDSAPTINIDSANGTWYKSIDTASIDVTITDSGSGFTGEYCFLDIGDNGNISDSIDVNGFCNFTGYSLSGLAEGLQSIEVYANDTVGNLGLNNTYYIQIDDSAPTTTFTIDSGTEGSNSWYVTNVDFSLSCDDSSGSGCDKSYYDDGTFTEYSVPVTVSTEANNTIAYQSNDSVGNLETSRDYYIAIDKTSPTDIQRNYVNDTYYTSSETILINSTVSDANSGLDTYCFIWVGGGSNTTISPSSGWCNTTYSLSGLSEGRKAVNVFINDSAGNTAINSSRTIQIDDTAPETLWVDQSPADIDAFNLFSDNINITYSINDTDSGINESSVYLAYKTNTTTSNDWVWVNGSLYLSGFVNDTSHVNISDIFNWTIDENNIYPATYNLDEIALENIPHSTYDLDNLNEYIKIKLFDVKNDTEYNIFEVMALNQSTTTNPMRIWYCNESYTTGSPFSADSCVTIYLLEPQAYNHTHTEYSSHQTIPLVINISNGMVAETVKVTNTSYFILRGVVGATGWNVSYITNISRTDQIQTTTNKGTTWTNFSGTIDAHLHQYDGTDRFWYYVCANDTLNNQNCTVFRNDLIDKGGMPPTSPDVYKPTPNYYNNYIEINWTASVSPNQYPIGLYNITLLDSSMDYSNDIALVSNTTFGYQWDSVGTTDGEYYIKIIVNDSNGLESIGISQNFTIDNTNPSVTIISPLNITTYTSAIVPLQYYANDTNLDTCQYSLNESANITLSGNTTLTLASGTYNISVSCNDSLGNWNVTLTNIFYVAVPTPPSGLGSVITKGKYWDISNIKNETKVIIFEDLFSEDYLFYVPILVGANSTTEITCFTHASTKDIRLQQIETSIEIIKSGEYWLSLPVVIDTYKVPSTFRFSVTCESTMDNKIITRDAWFKIIHTSHYIDLPFETELIPRNSFTEIFFNFDGDTLKGLNVMIMCISISFWLAIISIFVKIRRTPLIWFANIIIILIPIVVYIIIVLIPYFIPGSKIILRSLVI